MKMLQTYLLFLLLQQHQAAQLLLHKGVAWVLQECPAMQPLAAAVAATVAAAKTAAGGMQLPFLVPGT